MISFTLKCQNGHSFDSWFASGTAFDTLVAAGHVACIDCGSTDVRKALMAPAVSTDRAAPPAQIAAPAPDAPTGTATSGPPAHLRALAELRKHVEETATYVGKSFAADVRAMDDGTAPERPIWGEVTGAEARALIEDGLPVAPLPFGPREKAN